MLAPANARCTHAVGSDFLPPHDYVALQAPLSVGFPRQEYWSGQPFPSPGDLPNPEIETASLESPALAGGFLSTVPPWGAPIGPSVAVQSLSHPRLFTTPQTAACQASLSSSLSQSLCKLMSIESVMPSSHFILCHPLLFLPEIFLSIRVLSNELPLCIRWPKYWSFRFSISLSNDYSGLVSFRIDWFDLLAVEGTLIIMKVLLKLFYRNYA